MSAATPKRKASRRYVFLPDDEGDNEAPPVSESGLGGNPSPPIRDITSTRATRDDDSPSNAQSTSLEPTAQPSPVHHQSTTALHQSPTAVTLASPETITLRLRESARYQRETEVRVGRKELLGGMMERFATTLGKAQDQLRFVMYDGTRIEIGNTADELELEDGEVIDVLGEQLGGVFQL